MAKNIKAMEGVLSCQATSGLCLRILGLWVKLAAGFRPIEKRHQLHTRLASSHE